MKSQPLAEFTFKAVAAGVVLGVVFGAANAYLGLRVGMTVSASIPAAVMTVALFKLFRRSGSILEANISQTIGSASTALATGSIYTLPALFLWNMAPPYFQVVILCFLGGILGIASMIPLRRLLIVQAHDELPYPEGTACAEVLRATASGASGSEWIFRGMAVGAALKFLLSLAFLFPAVMTAPLPFLPKAELALELAPALIGVGFILGYRQSAVIVAGSILSAIALIPLIAWLGEGMTSPLFPETTKVVAQMSTDEIWSRYVRYIGAGAVAAAGLLTVLRGLPTMVTAFAAVAEGIRRRSASDLAGSVPSTDRDLPGYFVFGAIAFVVLVAGIVPGVFAGGMGPGPRAVCALGVGLFGLLFTAVAARIVGIVGVTSQPTSGIALITLLATASVFAAAGWTTPEARAAVLTVGTIVAIAASKAGDISQDLKTGYLVGATPARQQFGQIISASVACWAVAGTLILLGTVYTFGSKDVPAPQATLMKTIVEGVLSGALPWRLVLTGVGVSLTSILCGVSGLAFAIGVYLPLSSMAAIYVGGCARALTDWRRPSREQRENDPGVLAASGLVAGEGLAGVLVAGLVAGKLAPRSLEPRIQGVAGDVTAVLCVLAVGLFLYRAGARGRS